MSQRPDNSQRQYQVPNRDLCWGIQTASVLAIDDTRHKFLRSKLADQRAD